MSTDRPEPRRRVELVTVRAVVIILLTLLILFTIPLMTWVLVDVLIALVITAGLGRVVARLEQRGIRRGNAAGITVVAFSAAGVLAVLYLLNPFVDGAQEFFDNLPVYVAAFLEWLPSNPTLFARIEALAIEISNNPQVLFQGILSLSGGVLGLAISLLGVLGNALIIVTMTFYFLIDGPRIYDWLARHLIRSESNRTKMDATLPGMEHAVGEWLHGQVILSLSMGTYVFVCLSILDVPEPFFLAVIAALLDAIPYIGSTLSIVPGILAGFSVSVEVGIVVAIVYFGWQAFENQWYGPKVFGQSIHVPPSIIFFAILITGSLFGLLVMMMTVPITASLAAIDRIWFRGASATSAPSTHGELTPVEGVVGTDAPVAGLAGGQSK